MLKMYQRKKDNQYEDGDDLELSRWVFGISRLFGHWPYTCKINNIKQIKMTGCDCFWLVIVLVINSICMWSKMAPLYTSSFSKFVMSIHMALVSLSVLYTMSNVLISIWNRHKLLRIISNNHRFDRKVSDLIRKA